MVAIFPGGRGNCYQVNHYRCGVPGCEESDTREEVIPQGMPAPDPETGPDGWRLLNGLWVCPRHEIHVDPAWDHDCIGRLEMVAGEDWWRYNE